MLPAQDGLTTSEARKKLEKFGPNVLPENPPPSDILIFASQLKNPLVYVLLFAGIAAFFLKHYSDTSVILIAVLINTFLGFVQERRATRALYALKKLVEHKAQVVRDGEIREVSVEQLVPDDIVVLTQGAIVPADGVVLESNRFSVSEAILTGESAPCTKVKRNPVFMGTIVTGGRAFMEITTTGAETEIGKIAIKVQEESEQTPLKRQLEKLSKQLSALVAVLTTVVFAVGLLTGKEVVEILLISIALAVSAIPEGLLVGLTVVLAIGMQKMLARKGLVRRLVSAETLGGVTTICIDKTGTLTKGKLSVSEVMGDEAHLAEQLVLANDLDDPLLIAGFEWAKDKIQLEDSRHPRLDSIPFSAKDRFFASLNKLDAHSNLIFVNGAPEYLLKWSNLNPLEKDNVLKNVEELTSQGKRLLGFGKKVVSCRKSKITPSDVKENLEWVGLVAFWDPVREGVRKALEEIKSAGINLIVITGDHSQTAASVIKEVGIDISEDQIILGSSLEKMSVETLREHLSGFKLFARTSPDQKEKIVNALKENGEVVAMMGDGVNDAPALNKAHIGVVVGEATDVARESADLVLLDSNFATIVAGIEEGRGIFDNIRKVILYLLSDSFEEIIAVAGAMLFGLPLPVTAAQVLWINLVSDGFPHLALTAEPVREGVMKEPPRDPKENIVSPWMRRLIAIVSLAGGAMAFMLFVLTYKTSSSLELSRSVAFAALGVNSLFYVFSIKTLKEPFWREKIFSNKWLIRAVFAGLVLQVSPFVLPQLGRFLGVIPLGVVEWGMVLASSFLMFTIIEISKFAFRKSIKG